MILTVAHYFQLFFCSAVRVGSTSSEGGVEKTNERGGGSEVDEMDSASSQRSYSTASPVMLPASAQATQSSPGNFVSAMTQKTLYL